MVTMVWRSTEASEGSGLLPLIMRRNNVIQEWDKEGLSELHIACLSSQLASIEVIVAPGFVDVNISSPQGLRPIHMLVSFQNKPQTSACLQYLLEHGADVNVATQTGQTPLHLAAAGGLMECTRMLVWAGADVLAMDGLGCTPLELACFWSRKKLARYLKDCMWKARKANELEKRMIVKTIYQDLVDTVQLNDQNFKRMRQVNMVEWAAKKGLPVAVPLSHRETRQGRFHTQCVPSRQPDAMPDMRGSVILFKDRSGQPWLTTRWSHTPRLMPDLPLDVLEREIFPRAFPSRINSPSDFYPRTVLDLPHLGRPGGQDSFPESEVAMHLVEVLEPVETGKQ